MLKNQVELHNEYAIIKVSSSGISRSYSHFVKIDVEDMVKVGKIRISNTGYAYQAKRFGKSIANVILNCNTNNKTYIDHINGNTLDNRKCNLRICTPSENAKNRRRFSRNNTGVVGIQYRKNGNYEYFRVTVTNFKGKCVTRQFNINKLTKSIAWENANLWLNEQKKLYGYII